MKDNKTKFFSLLKDLFIGERIEGDGTYVNLMKLKSLHFEKIEHKIKNELFGKKNREEIYDKLYTFFHSFFDKSGGIMFANTPKWKNIYAKLSSKDVELFYKTRDLYYIKTQKVYNSMEIKLDDKTSEFIFKFDVSDLGERKGNEKKDIELYFIDYKKDDVKHFLTFKVKYKEKQNYDVLKKILGEQEPKKIRKILLEKDDAHIKVVKNFVYENRDKLKADDIELLIEEVDKNTLIKEAKVEFVITKYKALKKLVPKLKEEIFNKALALYKKQSEIDYFIHKNAKAFLKEQFNLYMFNYLNDEDVIFNQNRLNELKFLKKIADIVIDEISLFEDELKRIWLKPRFVFNSNYVVTKDRLEKYGILDKFLTHSGINEQIEEWKDLKLVEEDFELSEIDNEKYKYLPFDTKYFKEIEISLLEKIDNLDDELDGRLIHSENFQALNTLLPKFRNQIQTIYIDPPFNLGKNADFDYLVSYKDSTWATLLENRIRLAREFLNKRGSIFVRCDYNGNYIVRVLLNNIFGENNFINELSVGRIKKSDSRANKYNSAVDAVFWYSKTENYYFEIQSFKINRKERWHAMDSQGQGKPMWILGELREPPKGRHWTFSQEKIIELEKQGRIKLSKTGKPLYLIEASDVQLLDSNWTDIPGYSSTTSFQTENSEKLLQRVIRTASQKNDVVFDFFAGSATTQAVAQKLGRKWLGVEIGEQFYNIELPRLKKVLAGIIVGISKDLEKENKLNKGGFFKYYSLEQYEDILKKAEYKNNIKTSPLLGLKGIKIKDNDAFYTFDRIYPDKKIDLAETISNLLGEKIKKITKDKIYLETKEIDLNNLTFENYPELKSLIYWGESYA